MNNKEILVIKLKDTLEKPKFISPDRKATSKLWFQKKSESTYESHFNTICERRAKSKTVLGGPVARYPHKSTINELALYYRAKQVFENNTNKTVDEIKLRKPNSYDKQKVMLKNKIRFLETNIDRPKILPLQDTLDGVFSTNAHLHNEQRKGGRYKIWAGLRYPANIKHTFNKHKDKINHWDEIRDGIFHEL